jgi:phytoene synthase
MHPSTHPRPHSTPANCAACRSSIRTGSQSFYLASLLLPVHVREPAYSVYAFCRMADDLIDREGGGVEAIAELHAMLDRIYAGRPRADFVERGFSDVVSRFAIPREVPAALIEGLAWDAQGRRYASIGELRAYAVRVAGTVGLMMTLVMGQRDPQVLARAVDLGVAMQLTNICRDIGEDARNGRIYMPLDWLRARHLDTSAWIAAPTYAPAVRSVVADLLAAAEELYDRAQAGIDSLPRSSRLGIQTARLLYREIGRKVAGGVDPVAMRAVTTRGRKLGLVAQALAGIREQPATLSGIAVPEATFLIRAVAASHPPATHAALAPWWNPLGRVRRMVELLSAFSAREGQAVPADIRANAP